MKLNDLLFVYGTLRPGQSAWSRIESSVELVGSSSIGGVALYDLGWFPGAIPTDNPTDVIHGDVLRITNESLPTFLDQYEGYPTLFDRKKFKTDDGLDVWMYVLNAENFPHKFLIPSGDWVKRKD